MEGRVLCMAFLLLAPGSSLTVNGQCLITGVNVELTQSFDFRTEENFVFTLNGPVQGGAPSVITWRRNGVTFSPAFTSAPIEGVANSRFWIGGDPPTPTNPCSSTNFLTAIQINGRAPGNYSVTVSNYDEIASASNSIVIQDSNPVTNVTVTQFNRTLTATWTAPVNTASNVVVNYRVFINNEDVNTDGALVTFGTNTYTLPTQYNPGDRVTVKVRAATIHYWSPTSTSAEYQVVGVLAPVFTSSSTTTSVTLSVSQPTTASILPNQYTATLTTSACSGDIPEQTMMTTGNSITFNNTEAGVQYTARVFASNTEIHTDSGAIQDTVTTREAAPDGSPDTPTSSAMTSTSITLTWTAIECIQRNGQIVNYIIRYGEGTNRNLMVSTASTFLMYVISNLKPFTNYTFTVAGATSVGNGPPSNASRVIRTAEDIPSEVLDLMVTTDLTSMSLTWREPNTPNGIITHYTITYSINGSSLISNTTTNTSFQTGRLPANTAVSNITVTASTSAGAGSGVTHTSVTIPDKLHHCFDNTAQDRSTRLSWVSSMCNYEQSKERIILDALYSLWSEFGVNPLGLVKSCPASSCDEVSQTGTYWIKNGTNVVQQECE